MLFVRAPLGNILVCVILTNGLYLLYVRALVQNKKKVQLNSVHIFSVAIILLPLKNIMLMQKYSSSLNDECHSNHIINLI